MGGKRNRRRQADADWEASGTDESDANASGHHKILAAAERGDSNCNGQRDTRTDGGQSREGKRASAPHRQHAVTLGPWTRAVDDAVQGMDAAQREISNLQRLFVQHMDDLGEIDAIKRRLEQAETELREKDEELQRHQDTIHTLTSLGQRSKADIESKLAQLEVDGKELAQDRAKLERRVELTTEEERHKLNRDFDKRVSEQDKNYATKMRELEVEFDDKRKENNTKVTALEAENSQLLAAKQEQLETINNQGSQLYHLTDQYDLLNRAKDSLRSDNESLKGQLEQMNKDFGLNTKPAEYFKHEFAEIYVRIEEISRTYFYDIDGKDPEKVHEELAAADSCFRSVPIDDTEDSHDLRTAHAQRVISTALCEDIWQPFGSELTLQRPELRNFLGKISDNLDRSNKDRRIANVWTALTMRALESLQDDITTSPTSERKQYLPATGSTRANSVINKVFGVLSSLVSSSQTESLRRDLVNLIESSVEVWNNAQAGGSDITISQLLDRAHREEWRSPHFDTASPVDVGGLDSDIASNTHPRVFTLFPRIMARIQGKTMPGSWSDSDLAVIHPGVGLPEWSPLVVRGKSNQEEREDFLNKAMETARQQAINMHVSRHGRRSSRDSSTTGPPSPSAQWKMGSTMESVEK